MAMRLIAHAAPAASGLGAAGNSRSIAKAIATGERVPDEALRARASAIAGRDAGVGKVHAGGTWREPTVHAQLAQSLGAPLGSALREDFEWYYCRGAFFHNDAHYDARLFGVWCVNGPPMEIVFPRAALRIAATPSSIVVFDPFEVHGVLAPRCVTYAASDYQGAGASVFVGFELDITHAIADAFGICDGASGPLISSRTRIDATSGAIEAFD